jgi:hypothetical protein
VEAVVLSGGAAVLSGGTPVLSEEATVLVEGRTAVLCGGTTAPALEAQVDGEEGEGALRTESARNATQRAGDTDQVHV